MLAMPVTYINRSHTLRNGGQPPNSKSRPPMRPSQGKAATGSGILGHLGLPTGDTLLGRPELHPHMVVMADLGTPTLDMQILMGIRADCRVLTHPITLFNTAQYPITALRNSCPR